MHTDPDLLGLLALGEPAGTEHDLTHTRTCPDCSNELSELHRLVVLARSSSADLELVAPSSDVWGRIRGDLDLDPSLELPEHLSLLQPSNLDDRSQVDVRGVSAAQEEDNFSARAQLTSAATDWSDASGEATLATDKQGRRLLQVTLYADLPASGIRQAWLVDRTDASQRQTLGILDGLHGLWTVDHSIDLQQFPILDITQQNTGQTEYSGQTVVRGHLALTR